MLNCHSGNILFFYCGLGACFTCLIKKEFKKTLAELFFVVVICATLS